MRSKRGAAQRGMHARCRYYKCKIFFILLKNGAPAKSHLLLMQCMRLDASLSCAKFQRRLYRAQIQQDHALCSGPQSLSSGETCSAAHKTSIQAYLYLMHWSKRGSGQGCKTIFALVAGRSLQSADLPGGVVCSAGNPAIWAALRDLVQSAEVATASRC